MASPPNCSNPTTSVQANTTFVQADTSNFRTIVQKLTGAPPPPDDRSPYDQNKPSSKCPAFKLHERRRRTNKLNVNLNNNNHIVNGSLLFSPVSTLDVLSASGSPPGGEYRRVGSEEADEKAIAEKGFYLHPAIVSPSVGQSSYSRTPRGGGAHQLLPLFPLRSLRDEADD